MEGDITQPWLQIFRPPPNGTSALDVTFRLVTRRGAPLLLLPEDRVLAPKGLDLYPAQSLKARLAKAALKLLLQAGGHVGSRRVTIKLDPASDFLRFVGNEPLKDGTTSFAVMLGNARAAGRRFVLLSFDESGKPAKVIKAGATRDAIRLINSEKHILQEAPTGKLFAPKVLGTFSSEKIAALSMEYMSGHSPQPREHTKALSLLTSWIDRSCLLPITTTDAWKRLTASEDAFHLVAKLTRIIDQVPAHAAIFHGDFVPWNIRVLRSSEEWRVLDWERGEMSGPPAWDWFHFIIQPMLLVRRQRVETITVQVERMLESDGFKAYAAASNILNTRYALLLAYLCYSHSVLKPSEGRDETAALLQLLSKRWVHLLD